MATAEGAVAAAAAGVAEWHLKAPNPKNLIVFFDVTIGTIPAGRIKMELFADIAPKTAENFRQFCTGKYSAGRMKSQQQLRSRHKTVQRHQSFNRFPATPPHIASGTPKLQAGLEI